ncbi:protein kinase-like protein [Actinocorallia herbida]|uniref:Protein kinase-like protein n=2 Tax=Actinocorallia herbida TaxID=58109 RepID=A0A3N1CU52_9ACTN|nr:protein kinase-like protein [Actinocorallia herbida]
MSGTLREGDRLHTAEGTELKILSHLGAGGQGEVYRVRCEDRDQALKWYYPESATEQQLHIVSDLVRRGFHDDRFLWPQAVVTDRTGGFGYLMDLRPARFAGLPDLFRRRLNVKPRELLTACVHLVEAYRALHAQGVAYRDISYGNVFFDPATGDVLVCDNDNAVVDGTDVGVLGTMEFMAPELIRGEAAPRTQTDLHSLAVLLFLILMNHHPLEGAREYAIRCFEENAKRRLYGDEPVFVFDPRDESNRPVAGFHDTVLATWPVWPADLRDLFVKAFTVGLRSPDARVTETEWRDTLARTRDSVVLCLGCSRQNMHDPADPGAVCWGCGQALVLPPVLELTTPSPRVTRRIVLERDARLHPHHLVGEPDRHRYAEAIGEVAEHPQVPGRFGLRNLTAAPWTIRRADGSRQDIEPGRSLDLRAEVLLEIGDAQGVLTKG